MSSSVRATAGFTQCDTATSDGCRHLVWGFAGAAACASPAALATCSEKLNGGFKFDPAIWAASAARHGHWDMSRVFKMFDGDSDGYLSMRELQRAFRAIAAASAWRQLVSQAATGEEAVANP